MKKILAMAFAVILACGIFAGCGGNADNSNKTDDSKFNITVAISNSESEVELFKIWKKAYEEKHSDVNIVYETFAEGDTPTETFIANKRSSRLSLPMMTWVSDTEAAYLATEANFVDLRKFYEADSSTDYTNYYSSMLNLASYTNEFKPTTAYSGSYSSDKSDDESYGIWFAPRDYNKVTIAINKAIFTELGVAVPADDDTWNWEKLAFTVQTLAEKIVKGGANTSRLRAIRLTLFWEPVYSTILTELEGNCVVGETGGKVTSTLDSAENVAVYKKLYNDIIKRDKAIDTDDNFSKNLTAMTVISRPKILDYVNKVEELDFLSFPAKKIGAGCSGYAIIADDAEKTQTIGGVTKTNEELCWDFIKFIISEEGQNLGGKSGGIQPVLKSLETNGEWTKAIDANLNHAAFAAGDELELNWYSQVTARNRTAVKTTVRDFFVQLEKATSESVIESNAQAYKNNMNTVLNK